MAYRSLIGKTLAQANLRPLLQRSSLTHTRIRQKSIFSPSTPFFLKPSLFHPKTILKFYELAPLVIIVGGAVVGLFYCIIRNGTTRDDVRFTSNGKMLCEDLGDATPRKFIVYNQKYKIPDGLKEALAALQDPNEEEEKATTAAAAAAAAAPAKK